MAQMKNHKKKIRNIVLPVIKKKNECL